MSLVRVKICGLTSPEQAATAAELGADFIGLVFAEQSTRRVTVHQARSVLAGLPVPAGITQRASEAVKDELPLRWFEHAARYLDDRLLRKRPLVVGVFADTTATIINAIADRVGLDLVQLSGHEPWEEALAIRRPVIKAVRIAATANATAVLDEIEVGTASVCLLDADVAGRLGGTGQVLDWQVAAELASEMPIMLAGGLTPENVVEAIRVVQPWAVDVSSGVEVGGTKNEDRMRAFLQSVRAAEAAIG